MTAPSYRGRFAPSPTGPLHLGSLVAALASWLDARAHGGKWLIRIENIDPPRERRGAQQVQLDTLAALGMIPDEPVLLQSGRHDAYAVASQQLQAAGHTYYCRCTRAQRQAEGATPGAYAGTCRARGYGPPGALRFRVPAGRVDFDDRALGHGGQDVDQAVGDVVIRRADGYWAYPLAVVVDDAYQGITDVVRGADLYDDTPRQILLQQALGLARPRYLHLPLVLDAQGRKLSKGEGAAAIRVNDARSGLDVLEQAWRHLGFAPTPARSVAQFHEQAVAAWARRWCPMPARRCAAISLPAPREYS